MHIFVNKETEDKIKQALILLERNNHLSASRAGLEERSINRNTAISLLLDAIDMTSDELGSLGKRRILELEKRVQELEKKEDKV